MKRFLIKLSYTLLPLWVIVVTLVFYVSLYVIPNASGDIGRLALIPFGKEYPEYIKKGMVKDTLFQTAYCNSDLDSINTDVLTIGDSFSQQMNGGYQNYLSLRGLRVVNMNRELYHSPLQYTYSLLTNDVIDSTKTRFIIVEQVERELEKSIIGFDTNKVKDSTKVSKKVTKSEIEIFSLSRTRDYVLYRLGIENPIYQAKLDRGYFTCDKADELFFYHEDVENNMSIGKNNENKLKEICEILLDKAKEKGITLILLIAVDKYDLYQKHILNNPFPVKTVNEDLDRILGKRSSIVLSKHILEPLVEKGIKDVFKCNDTHWSYIASRIIADSLYYRMSACSPTPIN